MNCIKITDNFAKITMHYDDHFKEIEIYAHCSEFGHRKCKNIDGKDINDYLQSL